MKTFVLAVLIIKIPLRPPMTIGDSEFLPPRDRINSAAELLRINESLHQHDGMFVV